MPAAATDVLASLIDAAVLRGLALAAASFGLHPLPSQWQQIAPLRGTAPKVWVTEPQLEALRVLLASMEFAHLVTTTVTIGLGTVRPDSRLDWRAMLLEQLRHHIRLTGAFDHATQLATADALMTIVTMRTEGLDLAPDVLDGSVRRTHDTDAESAATRNGELLSRLPDTQDIDLFARELRGAVAAQHARIRVSHAGQTRTTRYEDLYVVPHMRRDTRLEWLDFHEEYEFEAGLTNATVADLVTSIQRTVVLGDPGAGKSTFAAKFVHDVATGTVDLGDVVPFLLVVRDHTAALRADHELVLHYLHAACRRPYQVEPPPQAIEYLLLNGRALVVIDGLDELGDARHREAFTAMVDAFAHRYPTSRIVVTSRVVGYRAAPVDPSMFTVAEIAPFTTAQVATYATGFFALDDRFHHGDHAEYAATFLRESESADEIRRNPLMLSLLCTMYTSVNFIPRNRPELYEKCAELLFETWDRSRGIDVRHRYMAEIKPAVQRLAWKLLTDKDGRQAIPRTELVADLTGFLRRKYLDEDEAAQAADDFIGFCAGRAWVLTEVGSDRLQPRYGFVHRTFLEYFAAFQLVKQDPRPEAVWSRIAPRIADGGWQVAVLIAVQLLDRFSEDGADELIRIALCDSGRKDPDVLQFCISAMEVVTLGNDVLQDLADAATRLACAVRIEDRQELTDDDHNPDAALADRPLTSLLARHHGTDPRTAHAVTAALHALHDELPASSSTGPVHAAAVAQGHLDGAELTADTERWTRLLWIPSPADVRALGAQILVTTTLVLGQAFNPLDHLLPGLPGFDGPLPTAELVERLTGLGPALLECWPDLLVARTDDQWRLELTGTFTEAWLMDLPVPARCTAVLLGLPAIDLGFTSILDGDPLHAIGSAATVWQACDRLELPDEVAALVAGWVGDRRAGR